MSTIVRIWLFSQSGARILQKQTDSWLPHTHGQSRNALTCSDKPARCWLDKRTWKEMNTPPSKPIITPAGGNIHDLGRCTPTHPLQDWAIVLPCMLYIYTRVVPNYDFNSKPKTVRKRCFMQTQTQRRSLGEIWRRSSKYSWRYMDLKNRRSRSTIRRDFPISTDEPQIWAHMKSFPNNSTSKAKKSK